MTFGIRTDAETTEMNSGLGKFSVATALFIVIQFQLNHSSKD